MCLEVFKLISPLRGEQEDPKTKKLNDLLWGYTTLECSLSGLTGFHYKQSYEDGIPVELLRTLKMML